MDAYNLNFLALQDLTAAAAICILGFFTLFRERYSPVSRAFLVMTLSGSIWLVCFAFLIAAPDAGTALRWAHLSYVGVAFIPAAGYHFTTHVLLTYERDKRRVAAAWAVSALFLAFILSTDFLFSDVYRYSWGYYPKFTASSTIFLTYFAFMIAVVVRRFLAEYRRARKNSMRWLRARDFLRFFAVAYLASFDFAAAFGMPLSPFGSVFILLAVFFAVRVVRRYGFIDVTPAFAASTIMDTMSDALLIVDPEGVIRHSNRAAARLFGMPQGVLEGREASSVFPAAEPACSHEDLCRTGANGSWETSYDRGPQDRRALKISGAVIHDRARRPIAVVYTAQDITERKQAEEKIRFLAYYDPLTELPNRTFYNEILSRAITYGKRHKVEMAVLFIDLDSFKQVNDTLGHSAGDELLKAVGAQLSKCIRKTDYVARLDEERVPDTVSRLGGDEFIVLLNEIREGGDAARVAIRLLDALARPFTVNGREVFISASIGISLFPEDGDDVDGLLQNADTAMYAAKELGKNQYQFYTAQMNIASRKRLDREKELKTAVQEGNFVLLYQPRYDLATSALVGMEALVRWQHPTRGLLPPAEFLPLAEETGLIVPLDELVLHRACECVARWKAENRPVVPVSINLSSRCFETRLQDMIEGIPAATGLAAHLVEFEIKEGTLFENPQNAAAVLRECSSRGSRISVDNFGTGHSSVRQLSELPLKALRIDRSVIELISGGMEGRAVAQAVIAMAHHLKLRVVAVGVETADQLELLRSFGCDEVQGFYFSMPVPEEEMRDLLGRRSTRRPPAADGRPPLPASQYSI